MTVQAKRKISLLTGTAVIVLAIAYGFMPQPVSVDVAKVIRAPMRVTVDEQGKTRVKDLYTIYAPVAGYLHRITLKAGDPVEQGRQVALLAPVLSQALDPRSRAEAEAAVSAARGALNAAEEQERAAQADEDYREKRLVRLKALYEKNSIAADTLDQAEADARRAGAVHQSAGAGVKVARSELQRVRMTLENFAAGRPGLQDLIPVRSPVQGKVLRIYRESEGSAGMGEPLMDVGNPENLEVRVEVLSTDAVKIRKGTPVVFDRWGGEVPLYGRVRVVEPSGFTKISSLGVEEQRVIVLIDLTAPADAGRRLGDAYRLEAGFIIWEGKDVLQVPAGAAFRSGRGWAVYVAENGKARLRTVTIGHGNGLFTEILSGVRAGDMVITHPDDAVRDGTRIRPNP